MKDSILDITINIMDGGKLVSRHNEQIKILTPDVDEFMAGLMRHAPTIRSAPPKEGGGAGAYLWRPRCRESPYPAGDGNVWDSMRLLPGGDGSGRRGALAFSQAALGYNEVF
jgi:hypothetical protein